MSKEKDIEFVDENEEQREQNKYRLKDFINGNLLVRAGVLKQLPFIIFIAIMGIVYIANRYHAEHVLRETLQLQIELQELRAESIATTSELMFISQQSQVLKMVKEKKLDLKEARIPPVRIKMRD
jgi:hypothetical protein